jgi:hypothetical protein
MDWCVKPRGAANHRPVAVLNGRCGSEIQRLSAAPGEVVELDARASTDPDGNGVAGEWFIYREAGTYRREISLSSTSELITRLVAPEVKQPATIHVILQLKDDGQPPLSDFRRAVVMIKP